jgi:hypothetical protein
MRSSYVLHLAPFSDFDVPLDQMKETAWPHPQPAFW